MGSCARFNCLRPANPAPSRRSNNGDGNNNVVVFAETWEESEQIGGLVRFSHDQMNLATQGFQSRVLGRGSFGTVYLGVIDDREVAIKRRSHTSPFPATDMLREMNCLGQLQHPNIVRVIGYCRENVESMLVYEYMENGSLDRRIYSNANDPLTWLQRVKIALGAARGLDFVHTAETQMVLRDVKTSNILLDQNLNAKLSDFGLVIQGPTGDQPHVETEETVGTDGYADPDYRATDCVSAKSDVYGFGVILLEMLAGRKVIDRARPRKKEHNLVKWGRSKLNQEKKLLRLLDPRMRSPSQGLPPAAMEVASICHQCLRRWPGKRPHMSRIVAVLETVVQTMEAGTSSQI